MSSSPRNLLFRGAIGLYVACIFVLVASHIAVSGMDIGAAMYLQAPRTLVAGMPTAARGLVMDAPTGRIYTDAPTSFRIGRDVVGVASTASHGHLHAQLQPQPGHVGAQRLQIDVKHPAVEDLEIAADVDVRAEPPPFRWPEAATSRLTDEKKSTPAAWEGALEVVTIPADGEVPRGLPTRVYLLLRDRQTGAPVQGTITLTKTEGIVERPLPEVSRTDELGLVRLDFTATTSVRLTLSAHDGDRTGSGTVRFSSVASQFALEPTQLWVLPEQAVQAGVATLHRSGGILVDLYDGDRWVAADAFGIGPRGAGVRVVAPPQAQGPLLRLQVYQDLYEAGAAWDARWLVLTRGTGLDACTAGLRAVLELHRAQSGAAAQWAGHALESSALAGPIGMARCEAWLEAALLAVPHRFVPAPLLLNTQQVDRSELERWRADVQTKLLVATSSVLLVGFAFVLLFVLQGLGRRQAQAAELYAVELETAADEEVPAPAPRVDLERVVLIVQTAIIVLTLLSFGASLVTLLTWL